MWKSLYSQLSRKWPPLVHGKVVAYQKNQQNKPKTELINLLAKIRLWEKIESTGICHIE